jgi:drug/metabolite transporter (DMT)-like permease
MYDFHFYLGAAATSALYALALEKIGRERYEPDFTVVTVMVGVALTGGWVALRLALAPLPDLAGIALAWYVWWLMFWMFVSTGIPVTSWQIWQSRVRLAGLLRYLRGSYGHTTNDPATLAAQRGEPAADND